MDKEVKLGQIRRDIYTCFKFIGDLVHSQYASHTSAADILKCLTKDCVSQHLSYHSFGKLVLLLCGIGI